MLIADLGAIGKENEVQGAGESLGLRGLADPGDGEWFCLTYNHPSQCQLEPG